jgi:YgiT-type zinc finger domain-containing protein
MSNQPRSRCAFCKHGRLEPGQTTMTLERDSVTVVVKHVPALVCDTCGEAYLEEEVLEQLFREADEAVARGAEVEVRHFVAA